MALPVSYPVRFITGTGKMAWTFTPEELDFVHSRTKQREMEVKITSIEQIKPSTLTPKHLHTFNLSVLDHLVYVRVTPVILFYSSSITKTDRHHDTCRKLEILKKSLSQTLSRFYPLAGKIRGDLIIECDNEGANFIEAHVNVSLSQFLANPDLLLLQKLLPPGFQIAPGNFPEVDRACNIQVNVFWCGGIAIGVCNPHRVQDGTVIATFLKEWSANALAGNSPTASQELVISPAQLFPPVNDLCVRDAFLGSFNHNYSKGKSSRHRFVFSQSSIRALRAKATGPVVKNPTRVEAVSGFLWKCAMFALERRNNGVRRPSVFTHAVDVRKKITPPSSKFVLGNCIMYAPARWQNADTDNSTDTLPLLVAELRKAIKAIDVDLVSRVRHDDRNLMGRLIQEIGRVGSSEEEVDYIGCANWCTFGLYNLDFGWGRPTWFSSVGIDLSVFLNMIYLNSTRSGDGIEAWFTLDEQVMAFLQEDPELRAFASVNPSPLAIGTQNLPISHL